MAQIVERGRAGGSMRDVPPGFVAGRANALAETTIDYIQQNPR